MKAIEQQMCAAIRAGNNWRSGNTRVLIMQDGPLCLAIVTLHGNVIATIGIGDELSPPTTDARVRVTLAGWPTVTTRSRLNALLRTFAVGGACVYQRRGEQYFRQFDGDVDIDSREWIAPRTGAGEVRS